MSARTLTVCCSGGLANRLRVLVSGLAAAEASGRTFQMIWPRNRACTAAFGELLKNDWPVLDVKHVDPVWRIRWLEDLAVGKRPDPMTDPRPHLAIGTTWWVLPRDQASRAAIRARSAALLAALEPIAAAEQRVAEFRDRYFGTAMIGVHLRRSDFLRHRPDSAGNTADAMAALDRFLHEVPDAGIFLCTDDAPVDYAGRPTRYEGVRQLFQARYGARVVPSAARNLDRGTTEGIQGALVDLLLLRATQRFVGTAHSSFSELAAFGRSVPHALVSGETPEHRRAVRRARRTGWYWVVMGLGRAVYGRWIEFPDAQRGLRTRMRHGKTRLRDVLRSVTPRRSREPG